MSLGHKEDMVVITERLYIAMEWRYYAMYPLRDGSKGVVLGSSFGQN